MKLNEIEKMALKACLSSYGVEIEDDDSFFSDISVSSRNFTGIGFTTDLYECRHLKIDKPKARLWVDFYAVLNISIISSYVLYIEDGYINAIEGVCYGDVDMFWPEKIVKIEGYLVKNGVIIDL